jgi:DNA polymerase type B, organellar and viral
MLLCKVQFADEAMGYKTLGHLRKVNFSDKELFIDYLTQRLTILNDSYMVHPISNIIFSYIVKDGLCEDLDRALLDLNDRELTFHSFNNMNLPISMEPSDYGTISVSNHVLVDGELVHRYIVANGPRFFQIDVSSDTLTNKVTILGNIDLSWTDRKVSEVLFIREIKKSTIYFLDGEVVLRKQILPAKPFKKTKVDTNLLNNFITMDIETIKKDGEILPYLICAHDGADCITSYGLDQKELFTSFIKQLLSKIEGGTTYVYAHNLSGFDGVFIMKHLLSLGKVEPLLFNGKLISIKFKVLGTKRSENKIIIFKDSFLLLPLSLRKLCLAFNVTQTKGYFPFSLTNIWYTGVFPALEYWTGIDLGVYESLKAENKGKFWSFKQEAVKYCILDCISLHEIITKFSNLIFKEFKVDIHKHALTLPALAMRIYKTHFMPKDTIYQILGKPEINIRQSYTGGAVDVYLPHNRISAFIGKVKALFRTLYYYDVNSLYPYIMKTFDMPIGKPIAFTGNIRNVEPDAYGFFYCKITSPQYLEHPILQRIIQTSDGVRTIAGLGSWEGWICSSEMDNAMKYGYTFEIFRGYQFNKGNLFKDYVNKLYNLRLQYPKGEAMNLIAKLLMNSLYGKFGMKLEMTKLDIYDTSSQEGKKSFKKALDTFGESIQDYIKIDDSFLIIRDTRLKLKYDEDLDMYHGQDINIAVASAITAGARVHVSFFKNNPLFNLYYSDTDSAVTDKPLPKHMIGSELGQMKLEHTISKAVFLAPKVYALVDTDGS